MNWAEHRELPAPRPGERRWDYFQALHRALRLQPGGPVLQGQTSRVQLLELEVRPGLSQPQEA